VTNPYVDFVSHRKLVLSTLGIHVHVVVMHVQCCAIVGPNFLYRNFVSGSLYFVECGREEWLAWVMMLG
jgi:hypothetical protein